MQDKVEKLVYKFHLAVVSLWRMHSLSLYNVSNGISSNSFLEHKYSPNNIITIVPKICMIHQSHVCGKPLYIVHAIKCIKNNVTPKSNTFFDFSIIIAITTELYRRVDVKARRKKSKRQNHSEAGKVRWKYLGN